MCLQKLKVALTPSFAVPLHLIACCPSQLCRWHPLRESLELCRRMLSSSRSTTNGQGQVSQSRACTIWRTHSQVGGVQPTWLNDIHAPWWGYVNFKKASTHTLQGPVVNLLSVGHNLSDQRNPFNCTVAPLGNDTLAGHD